MADLKLFQYDNFFKFHQLLKNNKTEKLYKKHQNHQKSKMASLINRVEFNTNKSIAYQPSSYYSMKNNDPVVYQQYILQNNNINDSFFDEITSLQNQIRYDFYDLNYIYMNLLSEKCKRSKIFWKQPKKAWSIKSSYRF